MQEQVLNQNNIGQVNAPEVVYLDKSDFEIARLKELFGRFKINELDREDVISDTQLSKIEFRPDYIYIALQFPEFEKSKNTFVEKEVHCFVNHRYLMVLNKEGFGGVESFRDIDKIDIDRGTTFDLFYEMLWKGLGDSYKSLLRVKSEVQRLNQKIFEENPKETDLIVDIQRTKRNLVNFEGILEPLSEVLDIIENRSHKLIDTEDKEQIDDCLDLVKKMLNNINNLKQQLQIITETNEAIMTRSTNEIVKRLTGISILVLVPSTITGFFSMNMFYGFSTTAQWPALVVVASVLILTALVYYVLRKKNWI
jgi:magnesium transporter